MANSFVDNVDPNSKYWYIFRVIDMHGNISNPTEVLQVELVDTGNSIFPVIEQYLFPKPEISYAKPGQRYLKISPSSVQTRKAASVEGVESFLERPKLGFNARESIWGQKYKLRITSKLSGKKVDVDFRCVQTLNRDKLSED